MSLNFDYRNVRTDLSKEERDVWLDENWNKIQSMIFNTMSVGMNQITEKNYQDFYTRYFMLYRIYDFTLYYDLAFVKDMIGLKTNASVMTNTEFNKELLRVTKEEIAKIEALNKI